MSADVIVLGLASVVRPTSVAAVYAFLAARSPTPLLLAYILNFLDRQLLSILASPIKEDLGLTDTQFGAIAGLAFALRGSFDKVATKVFLLSPADVDVSPEERRRIAETGFYAYQ